MNAQVGSTLVPAAADSWQATSNHGYSCAMQAFPIRHAPRRAVCGACLALPVASVNYWPLHRPSSSSCTSRVGIQRRWRVNGLLDSVSLTRALCAAPVSSVGCPGRDPVLAKTAPGSAAARIPGLALPWAAPAPLHALLSAVFASVDLLGGRRNTEALALRIPALVLW